MRVLPGRWLGLVCWAAVVQRSGAAGLARWAWRSELPAAEQLEQILDSGQPWLITGGPMARWGDQWCHTQRLAQAVPVLSEVRWRPANQPFVNEEITAAAEQAHRLGLIQAPAEQLATQVPLTQLLDPPADRELYYASRLDRDFSWLQLPGLGQLQHLGRSSESFVWLSANGTRAGAHYDTADNFNAAVCGRKRVLLAPPSAWRDPRIAVPAGHGGA